MQVEKLSPAAYFSLFTELTKLNPPHPNDYPILDQMRRIGIEPGKPFALDKASPEIQRALTEAATCRDEENQGEASERQASPTPAGAPI